MEIPPAWQTKSNPPLHRGALTSSPLSIYIFLMINPDLHIHCKLGFSVILIGLQILILVFTLQRYSFLSKVRHSFIVSRVI